MTPFCFPPTADTPPAKKCKVEASAAQGLSSNLRTPASSDSQSVSKPPPQCSGGTEPGVARNSLPLPADPQNGGHVPNALGPQITANSVPATTAALSSRNSSLSLPIGGSAVQSANHSLSNFTDQGSAPVVNQANGVPSNLRTGELVAGQQLPHTTQQQQLPQSMQHQQPPTDDNIEDVRNVV